MKGNKPFVCSIQGSHGVGKSTLVEAMKTEVPGARVFTEMAEKLELMKQPEGQHLLPEVFQHNQRLFIRSEIKRWRSFRADEVIIIDRGPETTEFFTVHYPAFRAAHWSADHLLTDELQALRQCRSDLMLYLTASEDVLWNRARNDVKPRPTFERWLRFFEPRARQWFSNTFPHCVILDTSSLSRVEVLATAVRLLKKATESSH